MDEMLPVVEALKTWIGPGRGGKPMVASTAWRWNRKGARTPDGGRAYLRITKAGGMIFLRRADVVAFIAACSGGAK